MEPVPIAIGMLCKEFVDKHGGIISVESKLNEGTKFIISLPVN